MKSAIFPGTFDPITNGHVDIALRAAQLFDRVIVAVAYSSRKVPLIEFEARLRLVREVFSAAKNIDVKPLDGLTVDFARQEQAKFIVRGVRGVADVDYELQIAAANKYLQPVIETLFLPASIENACISSTMIREIAHLKGDVSEFVPPLVVSYLERKR